MWGFFKREECYIYEEFGQRLKECLKNAGYTQKKATEKLGLSKNAILNYTKGRIPTTQILHQLSQMCGVSMEYLLTGLDRESPSNNQIKTLLQYYEKLDNINKKLAIHEVKHIYEVQEIKKGK